MCVSKNRHGVQDLYEDHLQCFDGFQIEIVDIRRQMYDFTITSAFTASILNGFNRSLTNLYGIVDLLDMRSTQKLLSVLHARS